MDYLEIGGRLALALILGAAVGLERELHRTAAGLRTFSLVALGSCIYMQISLSTTSPDGLRSEPGRIAAQVVSGIGFLGGGLLLRSGETVRGLATAAGVWTSAALGLAAGAGLYVLAVLGAVLTLLVLHGLLALEKWFGKPPEAE
jgi:putative Mg2+ transporter-C (MgtC) family protein